jgi:hypothetical protein
LAAVQAAKFFRRRLFRARCWGGWCVEIGRIQIAHYAGRPSTAANMADFYFLALISRLVDAARIIMIKTARGLR